MVHREAAQLEDVGPDLVLGFSRQPAVGTVSFFAFSCQSEAQAARRLWAREEKNLLEARVLGYQDGPGEDEVLGRRDFAIGGIPYQWEYLAP